ncbi:hypothetical protein DIPPA_08924 [Diplonema papillatum]|nr:hypothetical protein DIPPA_08924 [Diplonema papillatum]
MPERALFVCLLLALIGVRGAAELACPRGYAAVGGTCLMGVPERMGWFAAERHCARRGGHLLTVTEHVDLAGIAAAGLLLEPTWLGLARERSGRWHWASGFDRMVPIEPFLTDIPTDDTGHCVVLMEASSSGSMGARLGLSPCRLPRPAVCSTGFAACPWGWVSHFTADGVCMDPKCVAGRGVNVSASGVVAVDGVEVGLGEWIKPDTFRAPDVVVAAGGPCNFLLVVTHAQPRPVATTGCERSFGEFGLHATTRVHLDAACDVLPNSTNGVCHREDSAAQTSAPTGSAEEETPGGAARRSAPRCVPIWVWPLAFVAVAAASAAAAVTAAGGERRRGRADRCAKPSNQDDQLQQQQQRKKDPASALNLASLSGKSGSGRAASSRIMGASPFHCLPGGEQQPAPFPSREAAAKFSCKAGDIPCLPPAPTLHHGGPPAGPAPAAFDLHGVVPHPACAIATPGGPVEEPSSGVLCASCQKFSGAAARQRLLAVHGDLAEELKARIVVNSTRCVHSKSEHIHVFEVANEFQPHTLGALSTQCCTRKQSTIVESDGILGCCPRASCQKVTGSARQRHLAVHGDLAEELEAPIVVNSMRCVHSKSEHIHVFEVANEFQPHTLGALSTVYSRSKPRLPRNTRIHIQHSDGPSMLNSGHTPPDL